MEAYISTDIFPVIVVLTYTLRFHVAQICVDIYLPYTCMPYVHVTQTCIWIYLLTTCIPYVHVTQICICIYHLTTCMFTLLQVAQHWMTQTNIDRAWFLHNAGYIANGNLQTRLRSGRFTAGLFLD